ncbi:hypothetical protein LTS17_000156 [Exophiala oligosperma]
MAKAIRNPRKKTATGKGRTKKNAMRKPKWTRPSGMVEILKICDDDVIRTVRRRLTRNGNDNFKQSAQSSPASESEPASPAVSVTSCSDVYPSDDSEDSDVGSIHREGEEEKTAAPLEYPEMVSPEDISVSPCVPFTRSMARLHQQQRARRTPIAAAVEDAYESGGADDDDDDRPLRQERRHFRLCLTSPKQDDCLESPQDTRERSPTHNVAPAKKHGLSKKSSQKKIVKTSKAKNIKPARKVTEEKQLNRLRSLIDEDLLVSTDRKRNGTTKNGRMHEASFQMIDRLLGDRNTASGDIIKLEKEVVDLKRKLADVKKDRKKDVKKDMKKDGKKSLK